MFLMCKENALTCFALTSANFICSVILLDTTFFVFHLSPLFQIKILSLFFPLLPVSSAKSPKFHYSSLFLSSSSTMEAIIALFARKLVERLEVSGTRLHAWLMPTLSRWILVQHHPVQKSLNVLSLTYFGVRYLRTMWDMAVQDALHSPDPMIRRLKRYQVRAFEFLFFNYYAWTWDKTTKLSTQWQLENFKGELRGFFLFWRRKIVVSARTHTQTKNDIQ